MNVPVPLRSLLPLLLLMAAALFSGCRKKEQPPAPGASSEESAPAERLVLTRRAGEEPASSETPSAEEEPFSFSGPLKLQRRRPGGRILPEDAYCGPLLDPYAADPEEARTAAFLETFWEAYRQGRLYEEALAAEAHPLFREELAVFLPRGGEITGYALGGFEKTGSRGSLRLRLYSRTASIRGVLYLLKQEGRWRLEDWELPTASWPGKPAAPPGENP